MAIEVKLRRGTANQHSTFTGAIGEVTVDITNDTLRVHDGVLAGGHRLAKHSDIGSGGANTGMELTLSTPTDGSLTNSAAYQNFTSSTKVTDAIDVLNQVIDNVRNNTFIKSTSFTANTTSGGAGTLVLFTFTADGTANEFEIDFGDGSANVVTSATSTAHIFSTNSGSPFTVSLTARNTGGSGEGSEATFSRADHITIFTADPAVAFEFFGGAVGGSAITFVDDGSPVYFKNNTTNIGSAAIQYTIQWGDGSANNVITDNTAAGGSAGDRLAHTFATSNEQEQTYTVTTTLDSHSTANPAVIPASATGTIKVYDTHTPEVALSANSGINVSGSGVNVTATNNTENTIGSFATYGIQYLWTWGDGDTDTVNTGSGAAGDTGGNITHNYSLTNAQQNAGTAVDYVGNLRVISNHTSSPFISTNFVVHVEPELRAAIGVDSSTSSLKASGDGSNVLYKEPDLYGNNRAIASATNSTQHGNTYLYAWGDSSTDSVVETGSPAGSVSGGAITHDYQSASVGTYTITLTANGQPDRSGQTSSTTSSVILKNAPAAPDGLSTRTLSLQAASQGTSKLASGFTDHTGGLISAGASLNTTTARRYTTTTSISTSEALVTYRSDSGTLSAIWNGSAQGSKTFTTANNETGTFNNLVISTEGDAHVRIGSNYPKNYYQVFSAGMTRDISGDHVGANYMKLSHTLTGNTNNMFVIKDDLTASPTLNIGSATLAEHTAGTYRYISGVPYYNSGSPKLKLTGATVDALTGQAYLDSTNIVKIFSGNNDESTSGSAVSTHYRGYSDIEGGVPILSGGIPVANVGLSSAYSLGDILVDVTSSSVSTVETLRFDITNLNGTSSNVEPSTKVQVHTATPTFNEGAIPVADSLGSTYDTDGVRITGFTGSTPSFNSSTDFYTNNAWSGAETVAGTDEAIVRFNTLKHFSTNLSTGYLPVGPDLNTGRSGAQYFRFAFKRALVANFKVRLTGTVSGLFIAAPGTAIDSASTLNGWLDSSIQFAGSGVPGGDTGNGGNGSNGCASTGADRIIDGQSYSNQAFTLTLGSENLSNAFQNQLLIAVKLESGDSLTALSIEAP